MSDYRLLGASGYIFLFVFQGDFTHKSLSVIVFGVIALVASGLVMLLPETLNRKLPDTIEDAESIDAFKSETGSLEESVELNVKEENNI